MHWETNEEEIFTFSRKSMCMPYDDERSSSACMQIQRQTKRRNENVIVIVVAHILSAILGCCVE